MARIISPLDTRYKKYIQELDIFSDECYYKNRFEIEIDYLIWIVKKLYNEDISTTVDAVKFDYNAIKMIENTTNHDIKAIEKYIRSEIASLCPHFKYLEAIHIGLTSQDINSLAFAISFKNGCELAYEMTIKEILNPLQKLINQSEGIICPTKTHGQYAVPSLFAKELNVYHYRLNRQLMKFKNMINSEVFAKFGGAVGNINALYFIQPQIDWHTEFENFVKTYGITRQKVTTQIEHYDEVCNIMNKMRTIAVIVHNLVQNLWNYINDNYLIQVVKNGETGSSTMPQKVNPIHFENAMGNFILFESLVTGITRELPNSKYQRDLKDSTILRNTGNLFGYFFLMCRQTSEGLSRIHPNRDYIEAELQSHPEMILEGIQTYLRYINYPNAYEITKLFSRGNEVTVFDIHDWINSLEIDEIHKKYLKSLNVYNYIGEPQLKF